MDSNSRISNAASALAALTAKTTELTATLLKELLVLRVENERLRRKETATGIVIPSLYHAAKGFRESAEDYKISFV